MLRSHLFFFFQRCFVGVSDFIPVNCVMTGELKCYCIQSLQVYRFLHIVRTIQFTQIFAAFQDLETDSQRWSKCTFKYVIECNLCAQAECGADVKVFLLLPCNSEFGMSMKMCVTMLKSSAQSLPGSPAFQHLIGFGIVKNKSKIFVFISISFYKKTWLLVHLFSTLLKQRVDQAVNLSAINNALCLGPNFSLLVFSLCLK